MLHKHIAKPITVILDNASIHKAKSERDIVEDLKKQGLTLYALPRYSPEFGGEEAKIIAPRFFRAIHRDIGARH